MKISKSQIKTEYQKELDAGIDEWQARANIINSVISMDPNNENYVGQPGDPEYYFTVQTVWNLCDV